jgi:hypothetical protein
MFMKMRITRGDETTYKGQFANYIPGLMQRASIEDLYETVPSLEEEMIGPDQARASLERLGLPEDLWPARLEISDDRDDTRAWIIIAMGFQKRLVHVLNANLIALDALSGQLGTDVGVGPLLRQEDMQTPAIAQRIGEIAASN